MLSGGLVAPAMGDEEKMKFMKALLTPWGKTWQTWPDDPGADRRAAARVGATRRWARGQVVAERDKQFGVSTPKVREKVHRDDRPAVDRRLNPSR